MRKTAPFGNWRSTISAAQCARGAVRYSMLQGADDALYWSEGRPEEAGRTTIVRLAANGRIDDILPPPYSARSRVHEYGGGEFTLAKNGLYFSNAEDQDIYFLDFTGDIKRITNAPEWRFADGVHDQARSRLICVAQRHGKPMPENFITAIPLAGKTAGKPQILCRGRDFYAFPRLSPDGSSLAWIEWDLPAMPWEAARLQVGKINPKGQVTNPQTLAGGKTHAANEPQWDRQNRLYFIDEKDGWSAICRWNGKTTTALPWEGHEFGRPLWSLGGCSYIIHDDASLTALTFKNGELVPATCRHEWKPISAPARQIEAISPFKNKIAAIAATDTAPPAICILDENLTPVSKPAIQIAPPDISIGQMLEFATHDGQIAHGLYYPPCNRAYQAPRGEKPPVILSAHGGPTGMADRGLKLKIQYWTSRGFGFFDIDYRGSTGYGRDWRLSLNGQWGLADAQDMENGARHLLAAGLADPDRLLISGSSAGGFTVLATLCRSSLFAAGASYYGIGDLARLQAITHKFESGYLHTLLGEGEAIFRQRSPLFHAGQIHTPIIFFQGSADPVVPPAQSRDMHDSLKSRGILTSYIEFEGESHGFRRAETIISALQGEYSFYAQILGFTPEEDLPRIHIENFTAR